MGYYTYYTMHIKNAKENELKKIIEEIENHDYMGGMFVTPYVLPNEDECTLEPADEFKWYDHDDDMIKLSKKFPEVVFELEGEGEEREDLWKSRYVNGTMKHVRAEIIYPELDDE